MVSDQQGSCRRVDRQRRHLHRWVAPRPLRHGKRDGPPGRGLPALQALPPPDLRQGGAVPPDAEEASGPPGPRRRPRRAPGPAGLLRRLLQHRPHRALGRRTPSEAFAARTKATAKQSPIAAEGHHRVRRDRIDTGGRVSLRYRSKLLHIGIGRAHAGIRVLLLVQDLDVRVITEDGELLGQLTLDPSRDYQPLGS